MKIDTLVKAFALWACLAGGAFAQYYYPGVTPNAASNLKNKKVLLVSINTNSHVGRQASAIKMWDSISTHVGFQMTKTTTPSFFTDANLAQFDVMIINYVWTIGNFVTDANQRAAVMKFLRNGGSFIVYHTSLDVKGTWPAYADSVCGMDFLQYNANQTGTILRDPAAGNHPATQGIPATVSFKDEWYPMTPNPRNDTNSTVLFTVNEATLSSGPGQYPMNGTSQWGPDHPVAWVRKLAGGGKAFCAIYVHDDNETTTPWINSSFFRTSMLRGAEYVAGFSTSAIRLNGQGLYNSKTPFYVRDGALKVEVQSDYRLQLVALTGRVLYTAKGKGLQNYSPAALKKPGLYVVKVSAASGNFSQRILVP